MGECLSIGLATTIPITKSMSANAPIVLVTGAATSSAKLCRSPVVAESGCGPGTHLTARGNEVADESYWTWKAATPCPLFEELPGGCFKGSKQQFESLPPGMRREILRDFKRQQQKRYGDLVLATYERSERDVRREQKQRAAEVNAKARERL